jgi:hypothetical protein
MTNVNDFTDLYLQDAVRDISRASAKLMQIGKKAPDPYYGQIRMAILKLEDQREILDKIIMENY